MATTLVPPVASLAVKDCILYRALRLAQVTRGPGRRANPEQLNDALLALNGLIDFLSVQRHVSFKTSVNTYSVPAKSPVTIGIDPTGIQTADINAMAPAGIEKARYVLTSAPANPIYLPLFLADAMQYAEIVARKTASTIPQALYWDGGYPIASLYFWPVPTVPFTLELWILLRLSTYVTINDNCVLPYGYIDMLAYNLAVRLADQFGTVCPPNVQSEARRTLGRVKAQQSIPTQIGTADNGTEGSPYRGGDFNYLSGM